MPRRVKQTRSLLGPLSENLMKRISGTDQRLRRRVLRIGFWSVGIMLAYSSMSGAYGIPRIINLELQKNTYQDANRQLVIELVDALEIRRRLRTDLRYIERIARTRYRMVYPGETIYRDQGQ